MGTYLHLRSSGGELFLLALNLLWITADDHTFEYLWHPICRSHSTDLHTRFLVCLVASPRLLLQCR